MKNVRLLIAAAVMSAGMNFSTNAQERKISIEKVVFEYKGITIVGNLLLPETGINAMTGPLSKTAYDNAQEPKEIYWVEGDTHMSLYHDEKQVDEVCHKLDLFIQ